MGVQMGELSVFAKKQEVLNVLFKAAQLYEKNLNNKNILVVYRQQPNQYGYFEGVFSAKNFHHLTGTKIRKDLLVIDFYERCLNKRLSIADFELADDGTTYLKKDILEKVMQIQYISKMVGVYNGNKPRLYTEKLVGNITCCLGFVKEPSGYFAPNTVLKSDIRTEVISTNQLIAIYIKNVEETHYNRLCYVAKGLQPEQLRSNSEIEAKLDKENLIIECNKIIEDKKESNLKSKKKKRK